MEQTSVDQNATVATKAGLPSHEALLKDLGALRDHGVHGLRERTLPVLDQVVALTGTEGNRSSAIEAVLRAGIERLGGGPWSDAAAALLGLAQGMRGLGITERRAEAAAALSKAPLTFKRTREQPLLEDLADKLLEVSAAGEMREVHAQMSRRAPAESRLAVQWVERFEAYNRIWTPVYALGADLTAYRATLLEVNRPYDRAPGSDGPDDPGYTQEGQAEGYARFALFRFAQYLWELRQFMTRYGGMWLFSDGETETAVSDAVYRIAWHVTPFNERDESWLRSAMQDSRGQELHNFMQQLASTIGRATWEEWLEWVQTCQCRWEASDREPDNSGDKNSPSETSDDPPYFPSAQTEDGIDHGCQVHQVVEACAIYLDLIDRNWRQIADWYHLDDPVRGRIEPERLYVEWQASRSRILRHT